MTLNLAEKKPMLVYQRRFVVTMENVDKVRNSEHPCKDTNSTEHKREQAALNSIPHSDSTINSHKHI